MPECSKMDCNYYVVNGMYYTKYDAKKVLEAMNQAIWAKKSATIFKFADTSVYSQAHDDIFQKELAKSSAESGGLLWIIAGEVPVHR